jgi:hypothetical protein
VAVAWTRVALMAGAAVSLGSCYKPSITDGGFLCGPGKVCPDGFGCGVDGVCARNPVTVLPPQDAAMEASVVDTGVDLKPDVTMTEAGGGEPICSTPVAPLCDTSPAAGDVCSPSCQRGCDCGRCNVLDKKPACVPPGTVKLGGVCTPGATDNCEPGLICLVELCGNGLARCYRHCTTAAECDGTACTITINDFHNNPTPYLTCDVPAATCDPVAGTGCPDPALNCYLTSENKTLCDCPRTMPAPGTNGAACKLYSDCAESFVCIGLAGETTPHCRFVCDVSKPACPATGDGGMLPCVPTGAGSKFGFCKPL